jgi:hypothetical protein
MNKYSKENRIRKNATRKIGMIASLISYVEVYNLDNGFKAEIVEPWGDAAEMKAWILKEIGHRGALFCIGEEAPNYFAYRLRVHSNLWYIIHTAPVAEVVAERA